MISKIKLFILTILFLTDCAYCPVQSENICVSLNKVEDQWQFIQGADSAVLLITCPSGIGGLTLTYTNPAFPKPFRIGLRYAPWEPFSRLEGFRVSRSDGTDWSDPPRAPQGGYLEVALPEGVFEYAADTLTLDWVDMYR